MNRKTRFMLSVCLSVFLFLSVFLSFEAAAFPNIFGGKTDNAELSVKDLIAKVQSNQEKIKDMYAETTTVIDSSIAMPGMGGPGAQKMEQKSKMWTKGKDRSRIEMLSPMRQTTIVNGDKMAVINPDTGQKYVQDMKKLREQQGMGQSSDQMDMEKALDYFNLSVTKGADGGYVIAGIPKEANKFLGKMEFHIDSSRWVPVKVLMYGANGKLMSRSTIEYQNISGLWVPVKNVSSVNTPQGKMDMVMTFSDIKINKGISDKEFQID